METQEKIERLRRNFPAELQQLPLWTAYRTAPRDNGKPSKIPVDQNGYDFGFSKNGKHKEKLLPFEGAIDSWLCAVPKKKDGSTTLQGVGVALVAENGYSVIDLDDCFSAGELLPWAADIVSDFGSYTEYSPSKNGLHIIVKGKISKDKLVHEGVEIFHGIGYVTCTGDIYGELKPITEQQEALEKLVEKLNKENGSRSKAAKTTTRGESMQPMGANVPLTDEQIIDILEHGKGSKGASNAALWRGDISAYNNDDSKADLDLCGVLAFYTRKDPRQMDRVFRRSALYRAKWDEVHCNGMTYGAHTIALAIKNKTSVYEGKAAPPSVVAPKKQTQTQTIQNNSNTNNPADIWDFPHKNGEGKPRSVSKDNLQYLLNKLGYQPKLNTITRKIEIFRADKKVTDININRFVTKLRDKAHDQLFKVSKDNVYDFLDLIASEHAYNPLLDYFKFCHECWKKDGSKQGYITKLCTALQLNNEQLLEHGSESLEEKTEFLYLLLRKWLVQAVLLAGNTLAKPIKPNGVLVLQGEQGIGKSRFFGSWLLPVEGLTLTEQAINVKDKDSRIILTTTGICEISEFIGSNKDIEGLKQFFTREADTDRAPYERNAATYPRRTSFAATVNDSKFLRDDTGERRYWVLPLDYIDWDILLSLSPAMVWGEVYELTTTRGETPWLTYQQTQRINALNKQHALISEEEAILRDILILDKEPNREESYTSSAIANIINQRTKKNVNVVKLGKLLALMANDKNIPGVQKAPLKMGSGASKRYYILLNK